MLSLTLTPRGHLLLTAAADVLEPPAAFRRLENAFARGSGHGLLELGAAEVGTTLPAEVSYWRDFAARFVTTVCTHPDFEDGHHADRSPAPAPERARRHRRRRPADGRCRVPHGLGARSTLGRDRAGLSIRARRGQDVGPGISPRQEPCVAHRRPCPLQPRREPAGRPGTVRVSGDLYDPPVHAGTSAAPAARPGPERVCRRGEQATAALVAPPGAARGRRVPMAEGHGRGRRDLITRCGGRPPRRFNC